MQTRAQWESVTTGTKDTKTLGDVLSFWEKTDTRAVVKAAMRTDAVNVHIARDDS